MRKMALGTNLLALLIMPLGMAYYSSVMAVQPKTPSFNYQPVSNSFTLHEPVLFNFTINNTLSDQISVDLGHGHKANFLFTITRPDGSKVQVPPLIKEGFNSGGKISIMPGRTYNQRLVLNERFDFTNLGKYLVEVRMTGIVQTQKGTIIKPGTSYQTAIEIKPRDTEKLTRVCETLLQEVITSPS